MCLDTSERNQFPVESIQQRRPDRSNCQAAVTSNINRVGTVGISSRLPVMVQLPFKKAKVYCASLPGAVANETKSQHQTRRSSTNDSDLQWPASDCTILGKRLIFMNNLASIPLTSELPGSHNLANPVFGSFSLDHNKTG
jgi:hypothetical protein